MQVLKDYKSSSEVQADFEECPLHPPLSVPCDAPPPLGEAGQLPTADFYLKLRIPTDSFTGPEWLSRCSTHLKTQSLHFTLPSIVLPLTGQAALRRCTSVWDSGAHLTSPIDGQGRELHKLRPHG
jgi:hypothetical protein